MLLLTVTTAKDEPHWTRIHAGKFYLGSIRGNGNLVTANAIRAYIDSTVQGGY